MVAEELHFLQSSSSTDVFVQTSIQCRNVPVKPVISNFQSFENSTSVIFPLFVPLQLLCLGRTACCIVVPLHGVGCPVSF